MTPLSVVVGVDTLPSKAAGLPNGTEVVAEKGKAKFEALHIALVYFDQQTAARQTLSYSKSTFRPFHLLCPSNTQKHNVTPCFDSLGIWHSP